MSGGSFDYAYSRTQEFADRLETRLNAEGVGSEYTWRPDVAQKLRDIAELVSDVSRLMREAEWLYSADIGEETFMARVAEIEQSRLEKIIRAAKE